MYIYFNIECILDSKPWAGVVAKSSIPNASWAPCDSPMKTPEFHRRDRQINRGFSVQVVKTIQNDSNVRLASDNLT